MTASDKDEVLRVLRAKAVSDGEALDGVLHHHLLQRLVAWVATSGLRDRLCLKGALLLDVFNDPKHNRWHRHTQCADFLALNPIDPAEVREELLRAYGGGRHTGASFDLDSLSIDPAPSYRGARTLSGRVIGHIQDKSLSLNFRVEHRDGPVPAHRDEYVHPVVALPSMPNPRPLILEEEAAIAERLESLYWRGVRGVRFEDFVDLQLLLQVTSVDSAKLCEAIVQAFARHRVPLPTALPGSLCEEFFNDPEANRRWGRFIRRQHGMRVDKGAARAKTGQAELPSIARALARQVSAWLAQLPRPSVRVLHDAMELAQYIDAGSAWE